MKLILFPRFQHHLFRAGLWISLLIVTHLSTMKIDAPLPGDFSDKFYHGLCFFILAVLADYAYPKSGFGPQKFLPLFFYGVMIEVIQYGIPYRSFSLGDMLADALGIAAYGLPMLILSSLHTRFFSSEPDPDPRNSEGPPLRKCEKKQTP